MNRVQKRVSELAVVVEARAVRSCLESVFRFAAPPGSRNIAESDRGTRSLFGSFLHAFVARIDPDVFANASDPIRINIRPDVVQDHSGQSMLRGRRNEHRDHAAARRSDNGCRINAQMVEQFQRVARFDLHAVVERVRVVVGMSPAAIVRTDQPASVDAFRQIIEILGVSRHARKAQNREPFAFVPEGQIQPVRAFEILHHRHCFAISTTPSRSGKTRAGFQGSRSTGSPTLLTHAAVNP